MKKQLFFALAVVMVLLSVVMGVNALSYSDLAHNATAATKYGSSVNWSVSVLDNDTSVNYTFSANASGSWVSDSVKNVVLANGTADISVIKTVGVKRGAEVCGRFLLTNASNSNQTADSCFVVGNTAPVWSDFAVLSVDEDSGTHYMNITGKATDVDGDAVTYSVFSENAAQVDCEIVSGTNLSYTPAADWNGDASCTVRASDGFGGVADKAVSIHVNSIIDGAKLSVDTNLTLGGSTQERSNPDTDTEAYVTGIITIKNSGDTPLANLSAASDLASEYNVTLSLGKSSLNAGESTTLSVKVRVPEDLDAVDSGYKAAAQAIGAVSFTASSSLPTPSTLTARTPVTMQAENNLKISGKLTVKYNGNSDALDNGDTAKELKPGQAVTLKLTAKNEFAKSDDVRMSDITFSVVSDDLDVDEEGDISRLNPKANGDGEVSFKVADDQEEGQFDVKVTLSGNDDNGAAHGEVWVVKLKVVRETHEIAVTEMTVNPSSISCERNVQLSVTMKNTGLKDEDELYLNIAAPGIKFGKVLGPLSLDTSESLTKAFDVAIPDDVLPGSYRIEAKTYYNNDQLSGSAASYLAVSSCAGPVVPPKNDSVVIVTPPQDNASARPVVTPFSQTTLYVALLVALNLFVLIIALALVARLFRR